ncbi:MAG TPA: hypothetical protein VFB20_04335 [Burkholderiales bacterium]|nr:hypothetical protein [Burkholderiales bacterium]
MSAVYDEVKRKAMHQQVRGFTTMGGSSEPLLVSLSEYSSSSITQFIGSVFIAGATVLYVLQADVDQLGAQANVVPIKGHHQFPVLAQFNTETMALGGSWVVSEPEINASEVVSLPWSRKVIYSRKVKIKTADMQRRPLRNIIDDFVEDEGNG